VSRPPLLIEAAAPDGLVGLAQGGQHLQVNVVTVKQGRASGYLRVLVLGPDCGRGKPAEVERLIREARS